MDDETPKEWTSRISKTLEKLRDRLRDKRGNVIEFPALPFAGAPPSLVILKGLGIPAVVLAHVGKTILDLAGKSPPPRS